MEGTDNGQMTPRGYPNFNSYVQNLRFLVFRMDGQRDGKTDGEMETLIRGGLGNLIVFSRLMDMWRTMFLGCDFFCGAKKNVGKNSAF